MSARAHADDVAARVGAARRGRLCAGSDNEGGERDDEQGELAARHGVRSMAEVGGDQPPANVGSPLRA